MNFMLFLTIFNLLEYSLILIIICTKNYLNISTFLQVQLFPTPNLPGRPSSLIKEIKVGGFLKITDVGFPPVFSKLVINLR